MALNTEPLAARLGGKGKELNLEKTTSSGRPKRQKTTHAPATPGTQPSTVNGESTSIGDQAGAPCTGVSFDVPDIWALIFEDPRIQNDGNTLATFARVNRAIGTFAVRLLYRSVIQYHLCTSPLGCLQVPGFCQSVFESCPLACHPRSSALMGNVPRFSET